MNKENFFKERVERPNGAVFFSIVSYNEEEVLFKAKKKIEKISSGSNFSSNELQPWKTLKNELPSSTESFHSRIFSYSQKIHRDEIPVLKLNCIKIAESLQKEDSSLKIIPGYLTEHNLIITSSFDDFHKIYLFKGIFAEIIYKFEKNKFHTYPSCPSYFSNKEVIYFFNQIRNFYFEKKIS